MRATKNRTWFFVGRYSPEPQPAFTLIELLVVVAIIALLISILVPSLSRAQQQARLVKCLSNMSNMPKAVLTFAQDHKGYAQLLGEKTEWEILDPDYRTYDYQEGGGGTQQGKWLKAWPVAYGPYLGITSLRRNEQYIEESTSTTPNSPDYYRSRFSKHEIFECPSDNVLVHNVAFPADTGTGYLFCVNSYAPNEDVFGVTGTLYKTDYYDAYSGQPWKDGTAGDTNPPRSQRLRGKMDQIIRPAEVALFCDGGSEKNQAAEAMLISDGAGIHGPYLENMEKFRPGRLPQFRHSSKGGLACAMADGSGTYTKPIEWATVGGVRYVKRYAPRIRISPYRVGRLHPTQP